ncbi:MAG: pyrrolo-quinoline quinone [Acidobacteria bacterium]|nr:pyrrolo-quinoline quinone [Acidobacteriota bacterium]
MRSGANTNETILTPASVNSTKFGLLGSFTVDGKVDAQPLYLSNVSIPNIGTKNVLYVVTEHDSVFAFDADSVSSASATPLWKISALQPGETPSDDRNCGQVTPEIGITSTPVIDRTRNAIYVVAVSKTSGAAYVHRIHALNLSTGSELFGGPTTITATFPGSGANSANGTDTFDPGQYNERAALLQVGATIYTTWGSHCDNGPYNSWVMSYSADTLMQTNVLNLVPNGEDGGTWMAGAGPAADSAGSVYFIIGNGDFDTTLTSSGMPAKGDCGNCFVKLAPAPTMSLQDYFTPTNTLSESNADIDFGSGGPLLLPDLKDSMGSIHHLAVGAGKDMNIYVLDRDNMGKFNSATNAIYQLITGQLPDAMFGAPIYFNNSIYIGGVTNFIKAFPISNAKLAATPASQTPSHYGYPGAMPMISASGATNGIVWAVENSTTGILHAYDATNLATEFYNSTQAANGRDTFAANKYITPMVTNGKVYVGTPNSVAVFGPLP